MPPVASGPAGDIGPAGDLGPAGDIRPARHTGPARDTGPAGNTGPAGDTRPAGRTDDPAAVRRRAEIARSLAGVRARIEAACTAAGRPAEEVTLIAVTKTFPVSDAVALLELGVRDLGENRDQQAKVKAAERPDARWHFVGQLQTNKARSVASYADVVHSVDRAALARALHEALRRLDRPVLPVFVQVSLDEDTRRGGVSAAGVDALAADIAGLDSLRLAGVMAVVPVGADAASAFDRLRHISTRVRAAHPGAVHISAGMSEDLEAAIAAGSTHVRVGSALLGPREPDVG